MQLQSQKKEALEFEDQQENLENLKTMYFLWKLFHNERDVKEEVKLLNAERANKRELDTKESVARKQLGNELIN